MARLEIYRIWGVNTSENGENSVGNSNTSRLRSRALGIELADRDRRRPLRNLGDPLELNGVLRGDFAVFVRASVLGLRRGIESYLITEIGRDGLATAVRSDDVQAHPEELCSPHLRFVLTEVGMEGLEEFGLAKLGEFVLQPYDQTPCLE